MSWWLDDPRYGSPGWTLIWPLDGGPYFQKQNPRKRRKPARAVRFADLQPDTILIHRSKWARTVHEPLKVKGTGNDNERDESGVREEFAIVEDRWFDPVAGQHDPVAGEMASVRTINLRYPPSATKCAHTLRGLAMQGYNYATPEQAERVRHHLRLCAALEEGEVAIIGSARSRKRVAAHFAAPPL